MRGKNRRKDCARGLARATPSHVCRGIEGGRGTHRSPREGLGREEKKGKQKKDTGDGEEDAEIGTVCARHTTGVWMRKTDPCYTVSNSAVRQNFSKKETSKGDRGFGSGPVKVVPMSDDEYGSPDLDINKFFFV